MTPKCGLCGKGRPTTDGLCWKCDPSIVTITANATTGQVPVLSANWNATATVDSATTFTFMDSDSSISPTIHDRRKFKVSDEWATDQQAVDRYLKYREEHPEEFSV